MNRFRKITAIILILVLISACVPVASAEDTGLFRIKITTDKDSYSYNDTAKVTVSVTNISDESISGIVIAADSGKLKLSSGNNVEEVGELSSFGGVSFSFNTVLSYKADGIGFFSKIILFFTQLFHKPASFTAYSSSYKKCQKSTSYFDFGGADADVSVSVWYSYFSDSEIREMNFVDEAIAGGGEETLDELENSGKIKDVSMQDGIFSFTYSNGVPGGVKTESFDDSAYEDASASVTPQTVEKTRKDIYEKYSVGDVLVLYSFNYPSDDQQCRRYFYDGRDSFSCVNSWGNAQLNTDVDTEVTVKDLKNISPDYEIVCFSGHGSVYNGSPVMCLTEKVTDANRQEYADDLLNGRIATVRYDGGLYYWVYPELFSSAYAGNRLDNKFIFIQSCEAFGEGSQYDYSFADAMTGCGASAVVGFHNSVNSIYGRDFMKQCVSSLAEGKTAAEAYGSACEINAGSYAANEGIPVFRGNQNDKYISFTQVNVSVIDRTGAEAFSLPVRYRPGSQITMQNLETAILDIYDEDVYLTSNIDRTAVAGETISLTATL